MKTFYGAWIEPSGKIMELEQRLSHSQFCDYGKAHNEGWIGIVYPSENNDSLSIRMNPRNTPISAIWEISKIIKRTDASTIYIEDAFTSGLKTKDGTRISGGVNKQEALEIMTRLKFWRREMDIAWPT